MVILKVSYYAYNTLGKLWTMFSTISNNLEKNGWATRFPTILSNLCDGTKIEVDKLKEAKNEINIIINELSNKTTKDICTDYNCKQMLNDNTINNIFTYFYDEKADRNLFETLKLAIDDAIRLNSEIMIETLDENNLLSVQGN